MREGEEGEAEEGGKGGGGIRVGRRGVWGERGFWDPFECGDWGGKVAYGGAVEWWRGIFGPGGHSLMTSGATSIAI